MTKHRKVQRWLCLYSKFNHPIHNHYAPSKDTFPSVWLEVADVTFTWCCLRSLSNWAQLKRLPNDEESNRRNHTHTTHTIILGILDNLFISPQYSHWSLIGGRFPLFERYSLTDTSITTGLFSGCSRRLVSIVTSENSNTGGPQNNGAKTSRRRSKQRNINKEHQLLLRALDWKP